MELLFAVREPFCSCSGSLIYFPAVAGLAGTDFGCCGGSGSQTSLQGMGTGVLAVKESHQQLNCFFWHFWRAAGAASGMGCSVIPALAGPVWSPFQGSC